MEIFADKLKRLRAGKELSQAKLAEKIFVSRSAVAKWEQGRGFPNIDSLQLIAKEFCVTVDELISDREVEILKVQKDKKLSVRTKLLIAVSVILAVIIAVGATLAIMYYPRRLSKYLDFTAETADAIYLEYIRHSEESNSGELVKVYLDESKKNLFTDYVRKIVVVPEYDQIKMAPSFWFCVETGNRVYEISFFETSVFENGEFVKNHRYHLKSGSESYLLVLFDVDLKDFNKKFS